MGELKTTLSQIEEMGNSTDIGSDLQYFNLVLPSGNVVLVVGIVSTTLTVTINPLCLTVIYRTANIPKPSKIFMASLTISDIGLGIMGFVTNMVLVNTTIGPTSRAAPFVFLTLIFILQSLLSLLLLTVDRYISAAWCLQYPSLMTTHRSKILVACSWVSSTLVSAVTAVLVFIGGKVMEPMAFVTSFNLAGLVLIVIMYVHILVIANRHTRRVAQYKQPAGCNDAPQRINIRSFTTVMIIVAVIMASWAPYLVVVLLSLFIVDHGLGLAIALAVT
ncbi:melanocortin receptor 4-like [Patiria miniata]|uniref:G-protein coupled receptors family 1 profile domain-containing protein n=1 Tax=Patiria miniata TaxID=46514 RepID=A0A913Z578_PATMI|nr:melanocortin receptor 4-like [Patiria miniata]